MRRSSFRRGWPAVALGLLLAGSGCGLDQGAEPVLGGPSEQGFNIDLVAFPDTLNADGVSTATIRLVVRDENGQPVQNHSVLFLHNGDGILVPSSASTFVGPIQTGIVMATDSQGTANVVYTAGTGIGVVTIAVRPYGIDAANAYTRSVDIAQQ
jgi:hypothetical protein